MFGPSNMIFFFLFINKKFGWGGVGWLHKTKRRERVSSIGEHVLALMAKQGFSLISEQRVQI